MSKQDKKGLVPERRFPEFKNAGAWDKRTLGDITKKVDKKNKTGKNYPIYSINNKVGFVPQSEQFDGVDSNKRGYDITLYKVIGKNTFAYNPARINVGSIGYSGKLHDIIISSLYVCFKSIDNVEDMFLQHFFNTSAFNESVNNNVEGGIRNYLFYENFSRIKIPLPKSDEQRRIADCLTSIDELITAQIKKLDALNTHKKGLMQQLFPAEGETVPKLRFPQFRDKGEWAMKKLSSLVQLISGLHLSPEQYSNEGTVPYFTGPSDFTDSIQQILKWTGESKSIAKENDTLITVKGSGVGEIWYLTLPRVAMGRQLMAVRSTKNSSRFIYQLLLTKRTRFEDLASGNLIPGLSRGDILDMEAHFPSLPEQQKIADCLASIDDLIANQAKKIEALKAHKKGLMQQLFPAMDEVDA